MNCPLCKCELTEKITLKVNSCQICPNRNKDGGDHVFLFWTTNNFQLRIDSDKLRLSINKIHDNCWYSFDEFGSKEFQIKYFIEPFSFEEINQVVERLIKLKAFS